jgi:hypothetical protein
MTTAMTTTPHPEEVECFRMPAPEGRFSPDKRYEYTYATRKSWEYIPALRRKDWRYFTNKGFTYAGKWLRSEQCGRGDGGDYWEVFFDDRSGGGGGGGMKEKIVSWDYDATLCWRECPYPVDNQDDVIVSTTREIMDEMITTIVEKTPQRVSKTTHEWSVIRWLFGCPSKCGLFDCAEITTMEPKYRFHDKIAEFWCFVTSIFYGSSLLLYLVKEEDWFEEWRRHPNVTDDLCQNGGGSSNIGGGWPTYIHFSIAISVLVMICSAVYHISLFEVLGCVDCFLASFIFASVTMTTFGIDILTQVGVLLGIGVLNLYAWRYSTRIALVVVALIYPFAMLSCSNMKSYYGGVVFTLITAGVACFILDRMGVAPLHSLWHILGGCAITLSLYHVVVNGVLE